jgi:MFS family permease
MWSVSSTEPAFRLRDIAVSAYGPTLVSAIGHGAVIPVLALRARELGADVGTAAFVVALLSIGPLVASLPAGAVVARIGERRALVIGGVVDAGAMSFAAAAHSVLALEAAVLLSGATWTFFLLARQGYMIDVVPPTHRARALSALGGSMRIGLFIGPLLGAVLIGLAGIPGVFVLAAVTSLVSGSIALTMPDITADSRAAAADAGHLSVWSVIHAHRIVLATVGTSVIVLGASRAARYTVLPLWADHIGLTASQTSLVFGLAAGVDMLFFYPAGWLMDRHGRTLTAVAVTGSIATGVLLLPLTHTEASYTAVAVLMAVGNGLGSGIVMTLGADHAPAVGRSQFLGAWRLCGDIGGTTGPVVISAVAAIAPLATACVVVGVLGWAGTAWVGYWVGRIRLVS